MKRIMTLLLAFLGCIATAVMASPVDDARVLFERYVRLEQAFDPAVADLYAEDAVIKNKRTYPTGQVRELAMSAPQYKALIKQAMPLAKTRGDTNTYSKVTLKEEGSGVRILAMRFSNLKKYSSPVSLFVAPDGGGKWLIREELSESQP